MTLHLRRLALAPAFFILLLISLPVHAGTFSLVPTRMFLEQGKKVTTLTITNTGDRDAVLQLDVYRWTEVGEKEKLEKTDAAIAAPPVFTLGPGKSQIVRVMVKKPASSDVEETFRLLIAEVPTKPATAGELNIVMKFSLPIFVQPEKVATKGSWRLTRKGGSKALLTLRNEGNVHLQPGKVKIFTCAGVPQLLYEGSLPAYVLPGQSKSWEIDVRDIPFNLRYPLLLVTDHVDGRKEALVMVEQL